jgi:hypothetical protein
LKYNLPIRVGLDETVSPEENAAIIQCIAEIDIFRETCKIVDQSFINIGLGPLERLKDQFKAHLGSVSDLCLCLLPSLVTAQRLVLLTEKELSGGSSVQSAKRENEESQNQQEDEIDLGESCRKRPLGALY